MALKGKVITIDLTGDSDDDDFDKDNKMDINCHEPASNVCIKNVHMQSMASWPHACLSAAAIAHAPTIAPTDPAGAVGAVATAPTVASTVVFITNSTTANAPTTNATAADATAANTTATGAAAPAMEVVVLSDSSDQPPVAEQQSDIVVTPYRRSRAPTRVSRLSNAGPLRLSEDERAAVRKMDKPRGRINSIVLMMGNKANSIIKAPTVFICDATKKKIAMSEIGAQIAKYQQALGHQSSGQLLNAETQELAVQYQQGDQDSIVSLSMLDKRMNKIDKDCPFVSNFYHVAISGMYWAGAKALFPKLDPQECILPIKVTELTKAQFEATGDYIDIALTASYYRVLGTQKQEAIINWMFAHMHKPVEGQTADEVKAARDNFHNLAVDVCKRGQKFVCAMMTTQFQSLDFMLVPFTQTSMDVTIETIFTYHQKLYDEGSLFDKKVLCEDCQDDFTFMDLARYADAMDRNDKKDFTHLLSSHQQAMAFVETFFAYFKPKDMTVHIEDAE
ncbi:hypothetical protein GGI05_001127 [Coemansia sp. RSA 2603]|nr:hypothetical protein GGI05_001127 [Coemansia sp. RSA 2603]